MQSRWVGADGTRYLYCGYRFETTLAGRKSLTSSTATVVGRQTGGNYGGLYYTLHRHFDPVLMRWTSPDPAAQSFYNLFGYCRNAPGAGYDPDGDIFFLIPAAMTVAIAAGIVAGGAANNGAGFERAGGAIYGCGELLLGAVAGMYHVASSAMAYGEAQVIAALTGKDSDRKVADALWDEYDGNSRALWGGITSLFSPADWKQWYQDVGDLNAQGEYFESGRTFGSRVFGAYLMGRTATQLGRGAYNLVRGTGPARLTPIQAHEGAVAKYAAKGDTALARTHPVTDVALKGGGEVSIKSLNLSRATYNRAVKPGNIHPLNSRITSYARTLDAAQINGPKVLHMEFYGQRMTPAQNAAWRLARKRAPDGITIRRSHAHAPSRLPGLPVPDPNYPYDR